MTTNATPYLLRYIASMLLHEEQARVVLRRVLVERYGLSEAEIDERVAIVKQAIGAE